ncbi:hypothetical protein ASAC_0035 [Acidilobus saccharovorans 345-15]|uniref:Uncharacterized protein n=1 Tax=Acidilobus saccharovorans (strain DSM 16705 / JCM 18335 / VKM B-2471 / 345-15) TaxID=666510 RepID=D9PZF5_ACIS3|nr:hypothetical protein [Acidilobus saccharovorans]ADL18443.1 hypothetical protein ASAC_0035 [Acidilobus saccharovorans 345-15]
MSFGHRRQGDPRPEASQGTRQEPRPKPIGDRCNPLCPFFRCGQRALRVSVEHYRGRPVKVAMCSLVGDRCVGTQCRYAYCEKKAMLPDGRCSFAIESRARQVKSFEEELKEEGELPGLAIKDKRLSDEL